MRVGRSGVSRAERSDSSARAAGAGLHAQTVSLQGPHRRSGTSQEPDQVAGAVQGRARVRGDEAEIRFCESALSWTVEERQPSVHDLRAGEPVPGSQAIAAHDCGVVSFIASESPSQAGSKAKRPRSELSTDFTFPAPPSASRKSPLVQRFPKLEEHYCRIQSPSFCTNRNTCRG